MGLPKGSKARADAKTDLIIKVLGLKAVEHVPVAALTPDELRRLSIAEMRAGTYTGTEVRILVRLTVDLSDLTVNYHVADPQFSNSISGGFIIKSPAGVGTTILEQDLFYSSYTLSVFSNTDKLLNRDGETRLPCLSANTCVASPDQSGEATA